MKMVTVPVLLLPIILCLVPRNSCVAEGVHDSYGAGDDRGGALILPAMKRAAESTPAGTATAININSSDGVIVLEDFSSPQHEWVEMNDPVMGGSSTGEFKIDEGSNVANFYGNVEIVSFLHAPGFIKAETRPSSVNWPDISSCDGIALTLRCNVPYHGLRLSFGHSRPPNAFPYIYGFKANLVVDDDDEGFVEYKLPFDQFTDNWDAGSGDPIVSCHEDAQFCPDAATKRSLYSIAIWGEGVEGEVDVDIKMIAAYGCSSSSSSSSPPPPLSSSSSSSSFQPIVVDDANHDIGTTTTTTTTTGEKEEEILQDDEILIEDFSSPVNTWTNLNDPVMGGESYSSVDIKDGVAHFTGRCAVVPFLHAPGFITMVTGGWQQKPGTFPDVASCQALKLVLKSNVEYDGYRVSFGKVRVQGGGHASGYKAPALTDIPSDDFGEVVIPFSEFSSKWDEKTGDIQIKCLDDQQYCPSTEWLSDMQTMSFWGEGVEGEIDLMIKRISAVGCASSSTPTIDSDSSLMSVQAAQQSIVRSSNSIANHSLRGAGLMGLLVVAAGVIVSTFHQRRRLSSSQSYTEIRGSIEDGMDVVEL